MEFVIEPTSINSSTAIGFRQAISLNGGRASMICPTSGTGSENGANLLLFSAFFFNVYLSWMIFSVLVPFEMMNFSHTTSLVG
jgi:hypothetical protein